MKTLDGLEVAVEHACLVRRPESPSRLTEEVQGVLVRELGTGEESGQGLPFDELHRDVDVALEEAGVVDLDHVDVGDRRHRPRLFDQPLGRAGASLGVDSLDRDAPGQHRIPGAGDHPHSTSSEDALGDVPRRGRRVRWRRLRGRDHRLRHLQLADTAHRRRRARPGMPRLGTERSEGPHLGEIGDHLPARRAPVDVGGERAAIRIRQGAVDESGEGILVRTHQAFGSPCGG